MGDVVRRGTKDKPRFYIRYVDTDGKRKQRVVKGARTQGEATRVLAEAERRVTHGKVGIEEPTAEEHEQRSITVAELSERFCTEYSAPKLKDPARYRREARNVFKNRVLPHIGTRPVASLTMVDIERMRDTLATEEYSAQSIVHVLGLMSKMCNWGRKVGHLACGNPVKGCERPPTYPTLDYLSKEEVASLLPYGEQRAPDVHPMIATAIYTGMRKGELFGLRWTDVHLDAGRIDVMRSYRLLPKSGKIRHLPIHPELARVLRGWRERSKAMIEAARHGRAQARNPETVKQAAVREEAEQLVFPVNWHMGDRYTSLELNDILRQAKCHVPAKPGHSLRHTFASHFMMCGGNILTLQQLLGHATLAMTLIYAHLSPNHLAAEVARMTFAVPVAGVADLGEARRQREALGHPVDTTGNTQAAESANS